MITLENNELVFRFPEVHEHAVCRINFQRTLRIPDDDKTYPLPVGLGNFHLRHIDDHAGRLPHALVKRGGVIMPMWQAEAMWILFCCPSPLGFENPYPFAVKIATGKINAVTGKEWCEPLNQKPQDYGVIPKQRWLDGYCVKKGTIRQFVAMPLGQGLTAEEQITGQAEHGGLQVVVYPMKAEVYERDYMRPIRPEPLPELCSMEQYSLDMGLAPGGQMKQEIYEDSYGFDVWDRDHSSRCFVTILDAVSWHAITEEVPPTKPITAKSYAKRGIPWFDYYDADQKVLEGAGVLQGLNSLGSMVAPEDIFAAWDKVEFPAEEKVISLGPNKRPVRSTHTKVREGSF